MGYSNSPLAYADIKEALDKAINAPKGIRISCASNGAATALRQRFNSFRSLDRRENSRIYAEDHPMWKRSPYDILRLRIPRKGEPDDNVLFIEKRSADDLQIEEIKEEIQQ